MVLELMLAATGHAVERVLTTGAYLNASLSALVRRRTRTT